MTRHVVFNATRYDHLPSGARSRTVGLAAGLLRRGVRVSLLAHPGHGLRDAVAAELGGDTPESLRLLDGSTVRRRRLVTAAPLPADADVFVTDYHPVHTRIPTVVTVHDLRHLAAGSGGRTARGVLRRLALRPVARRARLVVTPTDAVATECGTRLGVPPDRVATVPNGLSRPWRAAEPWAGGGPLVWIGTPDRRKGFDLLLRALSLAATKGSVLPLVVVGREPERFRSALAAYSLLVDRGLVDVRGPLPDGEVVELVRRAAAVVHPSRYEGFGMGVLEALAVGPPVLAGRCDAVAEVAGPGLALLDPDDVQGWRDALLAVARGEWPAPPPDTVARARSFTWDAAADAFLTATRR